MEERVPAFAKLRNDEAEVRFWHSYRFEYPSESESDEVKYVPQATRHPRELRLDDQEMAVGRAPRARR